MENVLALRDSARSALRGRRILVCLDRSRISEACLPYAVSLAKTFGSPISLVHVLPHEEHTSPSPNDALGWEISRQEAQAYLDRLEKEVASASGQPVLTRLEHGRPAERIADVAREMGAALTVLGRNGEGGAPAWNLGSTAQRILSLVKSAMFVAHSPASAATATVKRVLVPLDGSHRAESVLPVCALIARAQDAEILLVHVVEEPLPTAMLTAAEDVDLARVLAGRREKGAARYLEQLRHRLERAENASSVRTLVVRHTNECQCIRQMAEREQSDLVVLSAHGAACDSAQSVGSKTAYLLTHSIRPLLVLQDTPECEQDRAEDSLGQGSLSFPQGHYAPESP